MLLNIGQGFTRIECLLLLKYLSISSYKLNVDWPYPKHIFTLWSLYLCTFCMTPLEYLIIWMLQNNIARNFHGHPKDGSFIKGFWLLTRLFIWSIKLYRQAFVTMEHRRDNEGWHGRVLDANSSHLLGLI